MTSCVTINTCLRDQGCTFILCLRLYYNSATPELQIVYRSTLGN